MKATKIMLFITALAMIAGCYTERRATKQVLKAENHYPEVLASICGNHFPPVEGKDSIRVYIPGKVIEGKPKYITVDCDSLKKSESKGKGKFPCPPCDSIKVDTIIIKITYTVVNKAKEVAQAKEIDKLHMQLTATEIRRDTWRKVALIGWGIIALFIIIKWGWKALKSWIVPGKIA